MKITTNVTHQATNLQNFVRWTYEAVTKKSDIWKVYEKMRFRKKILRKSYEKNVR